LKLYFCSKEKNYNDKDLVLEEKAFMHRENQKKVKELQKDQIKEKERKNKLINEYKQSWNRDALTNQIKDEIQHELKQAMMDGKDMDTYEFDQDKWKKLNELKPSDDQDTQCNLPKITQTFRFP
jgi:hypothetical protein